MGDPFSTAAGVISVVGFAGQVTQGIHYLHHVLSDIKHAPESLKRLQSSLKLLESTIVEANELALPRDKERLFLEAHQQCKDEVEALEALVKKYEVGSGDGRMKRKMKGVRAGFLAGEFEKRAEGVERAKGTLEMVLAISHIQVTRDLHLIQRSDMQRLHDKLNELTIQGSDTQRNDKLDELATCIRSFSGTTFISSTSIQVSTAKLDTSKLGPEQEDDTEEEVFEEALETLEVHRPELGRVETSETTNCSNEYLDDSKSAQLGEFCVDVLSTDRYSVRRTFGGIQFGLGRIHWSTTRSIEGRSNQDVGRTSSHTTYTFFPSSAIHSRGIQVLWKWDSVYGRMLNPWLGLRLINRIPNDAPIISAVQRGHLSKVIELFSTGQASARDIDDMGRSLIDHAIDPKTDTIGAPITNLVLVVVRYLIDCGAEGGKAMRTIYRKQRALRQQPLLLTMQDTVAELVDSQSAELKDSWQVLEDIGRLCLDKATEDPYLDDKLRLDLWRTSAAGPCTTPIDSFYLYHDIWSIDIHTLALDYPGDIFSILLDVDLHQASSHHELVSRLDSRYSILASLYTAGIPQEALGRRAGKSLPDVGSSSLQSGHCEMWKRHFIHVLLARSNLLRCTPEHLSTVRRHIRRMLVLMLENGEDPHLRCPCASLWNGYKGELRTPTDLAIARNVLDIWNEALAEAGYDPADFAEDRVVSLPIEKCLGVWNGTVIPGTKKRFNLSPEAQRKFLKNMSYF